MRYLQWILQFWLSIQKTLSSLSWPLKKSTIFSGLLFRMCVSVNCICCIAAAFVHQSSSTSLTTCVRTHNQLRHCSFGQVRWLGSSRLQLHQTVPIKESVQYQFHGISNCSLRLGAVFRQLRGGGHKSSLTQHPLLYPQKYSSKTIFYLCIFLFSWK